MLASVSGCAIVPCTDAISSSSLRSGRRTKLCGRHTVTKPSRSYSARAQALVVGDDPRHVAARRRPARSRPAACRRPARAPSGVTYSASISAASSPTASSAKPSSGIDERAHPAARATGSCCAAKRLTCSDLVGVLAHPFDVAARGWRRAAPPRRPRARAPDPHGASSRGAPPSSPSPRSTAGRPRRSPRPRLRACDGESPASNSSAAASISAALSPASSTRTALTSQ